MADMQVGRQPDLTGWDIYEESRRGGAIVATGHEHSYSRTHLLSLCNPPTVASETSPLQLAVDNPTTEADEGQTFVFVNGLGGQSIRPQLRSGPWWASVQTSDQGANHGALFGVFCADGDPNLARFYFKDIEGRVLDEFTVRGLGTSSPSSP